jgi:hypothetical protein
MQEQAQVLLFGGKGVSDVSPCWLAEMPVRYLEKCAPVHA